MEYLLEWIDLLKKKNNRTYRYTQDTSEKKVEFDLIELKISVDWYSMLSVVIEVVLVCNFLRIDSQYCWPAFLVLAVHWTRAERRSEVRVNEWTACYYLRVDLCLFVLVEMAYCRDRQVTVLSAYVQIVPQHHRKLDIHYSAWRMISVHQSQLCYYYFHLDNTHCTKYHILEDLDKLIGKHDGWIFTLE